MSEKGCLPPMHLNDADEPKAVSGCFWPKLHCGMQGRDSATHRTAGRLAKQWSVPQKTANSWLQGDPIVGEAVENGFKQLQLQQARSYESSYSGTSSDNDLSRQNSVTNQILETADLSPTKQLDVDLHVRSGIGNTSEQDKVEHIEIDSLDWEQSQFRINPQDIFFCSRANGKLLRVGKGSFGSVYKGVWNGELVAVKVCSQQTTTEKGRKQFEREVNILHRCRHPNIVQFKGACSWKGGKRTVLVTEYMEKGDLCSALGLAANKCKWPRLGKSIALDVAKGLAFLHQSNIVHFDLKSGNILLDRFNTAKLADVGLAKVLTSTHGTDMLSTFLKTADLGTFAWAAPEALLGQACDVKADIFSYGILLWEICTAETPHGRDLRPIRVPEEAPQSVADLVNSCLQYEPAKRPSAQDIIGILQEISSTAVKTIV